MLITNAAFSGFSVNDLAKAKKFYSDILGFTITESPMGLMLKVPSSNDIFVYEKNDHSAATYTMLNIPVDDIDSAADELANKGVVFEQYRGMTDKKGVARGISQNMGPDIAWFKDPSGNILSILNDGS